MSRYCDADQNKVPDPHCIVNCIFQMKLGWHTFITVQMELNISHFTQSTTFGENNFVKIDFGKTSKGTIFTFYNRNISICFFVVHERNV